MYNLLPRARSLCQSDRSSFTFLLKVGNRVLRRVSVHTLGHIPVLDDASPHEPEDSRNIALSVQRTKPLEVHRSIINVFVIASNKHPLQVHVSSNQHGRLCSNGDSGAVARDLRSVVDEILGDIGVVTLGDIVLDVDKVGEVIEDGELFAVGGVGLGG